MSGVLSGIRVLDFTRGIAGPYCTKLFADWGADVVKIEEPGRGDPARSFGPFPGDVPDRERSGLFLHLNTNKRSVTLDLATGFGREVVLRLAKSADVIVENFRPGVMERLGFSYEALRQENPELIMTSISNFGQSGPYRDMRASEIVAFAMGGPMNVMGLPDREPLKLGANHVQYQAGNSAAYATLAAWFGHRYAGTPGQYIDVSLMETQAATINFRKIYLLASQYRGERGRRMPVTALGFPSGYYPCQDGYVTVNGGGQFWPRTCELLGHPEWVQHERWGLPKGQFSGEGQEEFEAEVWLPWVLARSKIEVMEACQRYGILAGAILTVEDSVKSEHYRERGFFITIDHPVAGTFTYPGAPFVMSATPRTAPAPAPTLGQHNEDVLVRELGVAPEVLARLAPSGTV